VTTDGRPRGEVLASISTGLVQLHSRYYGKGPTKAKTYLLDDTVICLLRGGFTRVERTLIAEGEGHAVHEIRRSFQKAMERQFREIIEDATGRKVIAYMSQVHEDPEIALEFFMLDSTPELSAGERDGDVPAAESVGEPPDQG
jgi:uncharacterized protein YbcI